MSNTRAGMATHGLPPTMAVLSKIGSPEDLTLRRPKPVALDHAVMCEGSIGPSAAFELRQTQPNYERACLTPIPAIQRFQAQGGGWDSGNFMHGEKSLAGAA